MKVQTLVYEVGNKQSRIEEVEMEFPNPRIAEIDRRMTAIQAELKEGDWKTIKFLEEKSTATVFTTYKEERKALRDAYNALEVERLTLVKK